MNLDSKIIGTGWGFPPEFKPSSDKVEMASGMTDINQSLHILLSTKLGERVMLPEYGCDLEDMVFESMDLTTRTYINERIRTAILYHEQRIDVELIEFDRSNELAGEILILIEYTVRTTNARGNMVYPLYKQEGSEI
ncbi:MAG: GPW/gp25 family protein [Leeuwenhoekiella sp.]